jgi:hypothetical protein
MLIPYLVREMFCASLLFSGRLETKLCCLWCTNNYIFQNLPVANSQEAASDRAPHSPGLFLFFIVLLFSLLEPLSNKLGENQLIIGDRDKTLTFWILVNYSMNQGKHKPPTDRNMCANSLNQGKHKPPTDRNMCATNTKSDDSMNMS